MAEAALTIAQSGAQTGPVNQNDNEPGYRLAPHNIEAEQALLGAILVNNDAYYRVSDFLEAKHFFEGIHAQIYQVAADMIRATKKATPVTIKTFLPADEKIGDNMTLAQYLARLVRKPRPSSMPRIMAAPFMIWPFAAR